jgi:hypothetical protein
VFCRPLPIWNTPTRCGRFRTGLCLPWKLSPPNSTSFWKKPRYGSAVSSGQRIIPTPEELRAKYSFETRVLPLPDANDFRVTLGEEEKERIKRQITASVEASLQVGSRELWQRLYEAVSHMAERLQAYKVTGEGVEHPFRDSVVTNLVKLVDILPKLNVTGDAELERLAEEARASLLVDPHELRNSDSVRSETAKAASAIADRMKAFMTGYSVPTPTTTTTTTTTGGMAA